MFNRQTRESRNAGVATTTWCGQLMIALPAAALLVLIGRLVHIQTSVSPRLLDYAERQRTARRVLPARRGAILDRCGRILAASRQLPSIIADPALVNDITETSVRLSPVLDMSPEDITEKLLRIDTVPRITARLASTLGVQQEALASMLTDVENSLASVQDIPVAAARLAPTLGRDRAFLAEQLTKASRRRFVWLKRRADAIEAAEVRRLDIRGVGVLMEPERNYPMGQTACHVLGFAGRDDVGLEGLERLYDHWLAGEPGRQVYLVDARRRPVWQSPDAQITPRDGCSLLLTIDAGIQETVERILANTVAEFEAESAVAIVTAPKTGDVLAMACWPAFDPNAPADADPGARRNRALTDPVEPGSAFKPIPATAVLNEGLTRPEEVIFCHNGLMFLGRRQLRDAHSFGHITMSQVVSRSSNIGMAILAGRVKPSLLHRYLAGFGFDEPTGIDLPAENAGLLLGVDRWSSYSPASIAMGQEIAVTPIQLVTAFGAIVNHGHLMRPRIVQRILSPEGACVHENPPRFVRQVVRPEVADVMASRILVETVTDGSGKKAALRDYQVLGKTGTAQVPYRDRRGYEPGAYLASFMAAAPAADPQICVLVQVRKPNPKIAYYGSAVSAPAVGKILKWTLPYLRIPPDLPAAQRLASAN
ncbi:MAG: penicillin-binding protein 2 [Phycisphaerales bacterium]|nr:MAG: penicillin-binding protein 2 [Phycisphaerales bacterium]